MFINMQKLFAFLYVVNEQFENENKKAIPVALQNKILKNK